MIYTWEQELKAQNLPHQGKFNCPNCTRPINAFAIEQQEDLSWKCTTCKIEEVRESHSAHEPDWVDVRAERDRILSDTDWTENPGPRRALTEEVLEQWDNIRQQARDIPQNASTPLVAMALLGDLRCQIVILKNPNST